MNRIQLLWFVNREKLCNIHKMPIEEALGLLIYILIYLTVDLPIQAQLHNEFQKVLYIKCRPYRLGQIAVFLLFPSLIKSSLDNNKIYQLIKEFLDYINQKLKVLWILGHI